MSDTKQTDGRYTFTAPVRMPFANLIKAVAVGRKGKAKGEPKFSGTFLLEVDAPDLKAAKAKAAEVAKARWPGRALTELKFPFTDGNKRAEKSKALGKDGSFFVGKVVLDARSKFQPRLALLDKAAPLGVCDLQGEQITLNGPAKFYNGAYVVPSVNFVAYEGVEEGAKDGVTAYLDAVLFVKDGERIGGGSAAETFRAYAGAVSGDDPTGGDSTTDDDIPF